METIRVGGRGATGLLAGLGREVVFDYWGRGEDVYADTFRLDGFAVADGRRACEMAAADCGPEVRRRIGAFLAGRRRVYVRSARLTLGVCWTHFDADLRNAVDLAALRCAVLGHPAVAAAATADIQAGVQGLRDAAARLAQAVRTAGLERAAAAYNRQALLAYRMEHAGIRWDAEACGRIEADYERALADEYRRFALLPGVAREYRLGEAQALSVLTALRPEVGEGLFRLRRDQARALTRLVLTPRIRLARLLGDGDGDGWSEGEERTLRSLVGTIRGLPDVRTRLRRLDGVLANDLRRTLRSEREVAAFDQGMKRRLDGSADKDLTPLYVAVEAVIGGENMAECPEMEVLYRFRRIRRLWQVRGVLAGTMGRKSVYHHAGGRRQRRHGGGPTDRTFLATRFYPNVAATKRWKSSVHSVPTRGENMAVRVSRWGGVRLSFDFAHHELRVLAMLAGSERFFEATAGVDVHRLTAARVFGRGADDAPITAVERQVGKSVLFALIYGMAEGRIAERFLGGDAGREGRIRAWFRDVFPELARWRRDRYREALAAGAVRTWWGDHLSVGMPEAGRRLDGRRKREIAEAGSACRMGLDRPLAAAIDSALRNAVNYPVQSTASSIAALAASDLADAMEAEGLRGKVDCFTHDSCEIDVALPDLTPVLRLLSVAVTERIRKVFSLRSLIRVEVGADGYHKVRIMDHGAAGRRQWMKVKGSRLAVDRLLAKGFGSFAVESVATERERFREIMTGKGRVLTTGPMEMVSGEFVVAAA